MESMTFLSLIKPVNFVRPYILTLLSAGLLSAGGVSAQEKVSSPPKYLYRYGHTLTIACDPVQILDSQFARDLTSQNIIANIQEGLFGYDKKGRLVPVLAAEMPFMEDEITYFISLKKGIKFHDGSDFDAKDVKYTFNRIRNHKAKSPYLNRLERIKSVDVVDNHTVRVRLNAPDTAFANLFAQIELHLLSQETVERYGDNYGRVSVVGTGPFRFFSWQKGGKIVLKKNYEYHKKNFPYIHKLVFKPVTEEKKRLEALRNREASVALNLSHYALESLPEKNNFIIKSRTGNLLEQIYLNREIPPFNNKKVRQALSLAIDREKLVQEVFHGKAEVAQGIFPSWHRLFTKNLFPYRPQQAKEILEEAGFFPTNPLKFELLCTNRRIFLDQAAWIRQNLLPLGIEITISPLEKNILFDFVYGRRGRNRRRFKAALEDWLGGWDPKRYTYDLYFSHSIYNKTALQSSLLDQYLSDFFTSHFDTEQKMWIQRISNFLKEDNPSIILCFPNQIFAYNPYVKRININPVGIMHLTATWTER
jgi:glutathione transport system substrate-binding protein